MTTPRDEELFSFSWLALKLLGRGLYSNPWSALSELVANGLDANAETVYVYIDASIKSNATVEVIDDGDGMSRDEIGLYAQVGRNKRNDEPENNSAKNPPKGRKGIGKLAALYLSNHFFLHTRQVDSATSWELDARDERVSEDEHPRLVATTAGPETPNETLWNSLASGTRITLQNVDLTGYGEQSITALGSRLANQFLLPESNSGGTIHIWVRKRADETNPRYGPVEKTVAYKNLVEVSQNFDPEDVADAQPSDFQPSGRSVRIPAKGAPGGEILKPAKFTKFQHDTLEDEAWKEIESRVDRKRKTYDNVPFELTGWIGVHATIDSAAARENDARFVKNRYYNPAQIRVYVRGKLASDRLLSQLGLTGTYTNYIEGEISFDILDEDTLPDIATSNRQDFDETDGRVTLLKALVRPIVRRLMLSRQEIATEIARAVTAEKERRDTSSKQQFSHEVQEELAQRTELSDTSRAELHMVITNKIQGDVSPKQKYRVFISHARKDRAFATMIDELLQLKGAKKDEIFFTSRPGDIEYALDDRALSMIIKDSITHSNTLIFYLTSKNFLASQYCLFEGGAGWATRSIGGYSSSTWITNPFQPFSRTGGPR
ncbi:putative protein OS=Tsukamurella paurometabola (strain ATCC 8368 / DSM / CCUG 35730 /CIP 100753 / JCM 10117 / KCTC 9821 / NBRC 16120 / NCIMB 702349/ NCTC 13040) OX=521096 GN=Tpau_1589 PE=4 SV=1 [Tsukamurella paurometabola]